MTTRANRRQSSVYDERASPPNLQLHPHPTPTDGLGVFHDRCRRRSINTLESFAMKMMIALAYTTSQSVGNSSSWLVCCWCIIFDRPTGQSRAHGGQTCSVELTLSYIISILFVYSYFIRILSYNVTFQ